MISKELMTVIKQYGDEIFDISQRELRVTFIVGKNFEPEIRVHLQEELPFNAIPNTEYLPNNSELLIEHLDNLKRDLIAEINPHLD